MYLTQGLHRSVQKHPERVALRHLGEAGQSSWTFAQMVDAVGRRAAALRQQGIEVGDRVAMLAPNNDQLILNLLACWWLGAVACPMNTRWSGQEWRYAVADCGAKLALFDDSLVAVANAAEGVALQSMAAFAQAANAQQPIEDTRTGGDALATILYTGGTTGKSKGVMITHANYWSAMMARGAELNNPPDGVSLLVAPLFHVGGLGRLIGQLIVGAGGITLHQFRADLMLEAIEQHGITDIFVVPTMLQMLLETPGFAPERVRTLNRIVFGAAPMPPSLLEKALGIWPQAIFFQAYGMTETAGAVCICLPHQHLQEGGLGNQRLHSVGRAGLGAEICIVDENGQECPRGEVGEIALRGPMVTSGYWGQPELTQQAFRNGWLRTGDGARMDEHGYVYICDRIKDMVITGGENVYPAEVEAVLTKHPDVAMAAVVGAPDERWGEAVHAVVVLRASAEPADTAAIEQALRDWCRSQLAGFKCPKHYSFEPGLPLSAAGKVLKTELRKRFQAAVQQEPA